MEKGRSHYEVLGVPSTATLPEIRDAYRRLARKLHPDRSPGTTREFQEINEAHEVLSDTEKRAEYDRRLRDEASAGQARRAGASFGTDQAAGGPVRFAAARPRVLCVVLSARPNSSYGHVAGADTDGTRSRRPPAITVLARYTLADLAAQRTVTLSFDRQTVCTDCRGMGAASPEDRVECPACEGRGGRMHTRVVGPGFVQRAVEVCRQCGGSGIHIRRPCATCGGPGLLVEAATIAVPLDGLVTDGAQMVVANKGHQTAPDRPAGDVIVRFKEDGPHPTYGRHPDRPLDLLAQHSMTLLEALTGTTVELPRLAGGKPLQLQVPAIIQPDEVRRFPGEGLPTKDRKGSLYVRFKVVFPPAVDPSRHELLRQLLRDPTSVWPGHNDGDSADGMDGWDCDDGVCRPRPLADALGKAPTARAPGSGAATSVATPGTPPAATAVAASSSGDPPVQQILRLLANQYTNFMRAIRNAISPVRSKL